MCIPTTDCVSLGLLGPDRMFPAPKDWPAACFEDAVSPAIVTRANDPCSNTDQVDTLLLSLQPSELHYATAEECKEAEADLDHGFGHDYFDDHDMDLSEEEKLAENARIDRFYNKPVRCTMCSNIRTRSSMMEMQGFRLHIRPAAAFAPAAAAAGIPRVNALEIQVTRGDAQMYSHNSGGIIYPEIIRPIAGLCATSARVYDICRDCCTALCANDCRFLVERLTPALQVGLFRRAGLLGHQSMPDKIPVTRSLKRRAIEEHVHTHPLFEVPVLENMILEYAGMLGLKKAKAELS
jgi:hypothetical protein